MTVQERILVIKLMEMEEKKGNKKSEDGMYHIKDSKGEDMIVVGMKKKD